jgi:gas vesicle protein
MSDRSGGSSFFWFLAGLGVGALVGVLYAPRSGAETRESLRSRAEEGRDQLREQTKRAKDQANDWIDRGRSAMGEHRDKFRAAYEAGRQAYREKTAEPAENL